MGKLHRSMGLVFLFGMLVLGNAQIAEGNTGSLTSLSESELYGYQSFSANENAQLFYHDIDVAMCEFLDAKKDVVPKSGADYCVIANVNFIKYGLSLNEAQVVYQYYSYDHPEYYWLSNSFSYSATDIFMLIDSKYGSVSVREKYNQELDAVVDYVVENTQGLSDDERVSFIHDMIIGNTSYAYYPGTSTPVEEEWAHNVTGYLDEKGVVCEGYAKMFQFLLNRLGIENVFVTGTSRTESHAWNLVKMDDENWYWFDLTWDDRDLANASANRVYYAMPDSLFIKDHTVYSDDVNNEWGCALYVLPQVSDAYTYYCTPSVSVMETTGEKQMVAAVQNAVKEAVEKGSDCAAFYFPSEKQYDAFTDVMFGGIAQSDGTSLYYYKMYLEQVPEIREVLGEDISYQRIGDYLYMFFEYAAQKKLPAIMLYANDVKVGSCGTIQEAFSKMVNPALDYEIQYESTAAIQMLPLDMKMPKAKSIKFSGCSGDENNFSYLFIPDDWKLSGNVTFENICLMGIKDESTELDLNGYQMKVEGSYVYFGNTSSRGSQLVHITGTQGNVTVGQGAQVFVVDEVNISKMITQGDSWTYFYGGGTIDQYTTWGMNDYLILYDRALHIKQASGNAYMYPGSQGTYTCTIDRIVDNSRIGFIVYPKSDTKIQINDTVQGDLYMLFDTTGMVDADYAGLSKTKHLYAPKVTEDQVCSRVLNADGFYEDMNWELKKQSDSWFTIVGPWEKGESVTTFPSVEVGPDADNKVSSKDTTKKNSGKGLAVGTKKEDSTGATYKVISNKSDNMTVAYVSPKKGSKGKITVPDTVILDGVTYKVVKIDSKAFKGNKNIKEIKIGSNVKEIGKEAFSGCSKLKKITIRSGEIKTVGKNAFKGIQKKAVVKVPKAKVQDYSKLFKKKGLAKTAKVKK